MVLPNERFIVPPSHATSKGARTSGWYTEEEEDRQQANAAAMAAANRRRTGAGVDPGLVPPVPAKSNLTPGLDQGGSLFSTERNMGPLGMGPQGGGSGMGRTEMTYVNPNQPASNQKRLDSVLPSAFTGEREGGVSRMGGFGSGGTQGEAYIMDARERWDADPNLGATATVSGAEQHAEGYQPWTPKTVPSVASANVPTEAAEKLRSTGDYLDNWLLDDYYKGYSSIGGVGTFMTASLEAGKDASHHSGTMYQVALTGGRERDKFYRDWWKSPTPMATGFSAHNLLDDIEFLQQGHRYSNKYVQGISEEEATKLVFEKYSR